jgi:tetratricopeptide (TPR) repeat protein
MKSRREILEEFLSEDPNDSFSRYALALELEKEGRSADAVVQLREVIERDRSYVGAYYHLGRLLARDDRADEARETLERGLAAARAANDQRALSEIQQALEAL